MKRLGAVALVCDTAVKDMQQVRALGFQYFALGSVVSHGYPRIVRMGVPVVVDGLCVEQGDLIHGDANGVLSVPLEVAERVAPEAIRLRQLEDQAVRSIDDSKFSLEQTLRFYGM
jgi:regulator of RNase E activity RraA